MQFAIIKYIHFFCFGIFFSSNVNCDQLGKNFDNREYSDLYEILACTSWCMQKTETADLECCFDECDIPSTNHIQPVVKTVENYYIDLWCRDDRSLTLKIKRDMRDTIQMTSDKIELQTIYLLKVEASSNSFGRQRMIVAYNTSLIKVDKLEPNTTYNISISVIHAPNEYNYFTQRDVLELTTLESGYVPKNITNISKNIIIDESVRPRLNITIKWEPGEDMGCYYDIVGYSPDKEAVSDVSPDEIREPEDLFTYTIENLPFGVKYNVGIRAKNINDSSKESQNVWSNFTTPTCLESYNYSLTICPPMEPKGLVAKSKHIRSNVYSISISWDKPFVEPDYYTIDILDLSWNSLLEQTIFVKNVSQYETSQSIPEISLNGSEYDVNLTAFSKGGRSSSTSKNLEFPGKESGMNLVVVITVSITFVVLTTLLILIICHRRAKLKRYQERCKYFEELEKRAPVEFCVKPMSISPSLHQLNLLQQELENKLYINDDLEINRSQVKLEVELLGEGAFGFVRRGLLTTNDGREIDVAVKMLKDNPRPDDIREFHREIEVMKFVGEHPNIVGLLGHCTKNVKEMMLLTEYCSLGSLLHFLRNEWSFINKLNTHENKVSECLTPKLINQKQPECVFNFDTSSMNKNSIAYKNINDIETTKTRDKKQETGNVSRFVVNKGYECNTTCTNFCKCQVDINTSVCLSNSANDEELGNKIKINNCECNLEATVHNEESFPLLIENKGYYKLLDPNQTQEICSDEESLSKEQTRERLTSVDLLKIAKQIASGMEFLSKNKVVHRDLAARNVLVSEDQTVKIADFGLSRDIYQENMYKKTGNGKLPFKWLALESLTHQVYTSQSDVWSYGILLYEIVTLGGNPYPSIPTNRLLKLLKTGYRMEKPKNCNDALYELMGSCWRTNPIERPTFSDILQSLDRLLTASTNEPIINFALTENNKRSKSTSEESYLKPI